MEAAGRWVTRCRHLPVLGCFFLGCCSPALPQCFPNEAGAVHPCGHLLRHHPGTRREGVLGTPLVWCQVASLTVAGYAWVPMAGKPCHPTRDPSHNSSPAVCWAHPLHGPVRSEPALGWRSSGTAVSPSRQGGNCVWEHPISVSTSKPLPQCFSS